MAGIRAAIRGKYRAVALSVQGKFTYPTGEQGALRLGYDPALVSQAPQRMRDSFCGVGNPFMPGLIRPGDRVLDIGCGAGLDMLVAGRLAGEAGKVCGIELTGEMAALARANLAAVTGCAFEVHQVEGEVIPYPDDSFAVVISNGVINLSPCKPALLREIYRVLTPGGALRFADVVLGEALPAALATSAEAWSQ